MATDLTSFADPSEFIDGPNPERTLTLYFVVDGAPHTLRLFPDTDPSTLWAEAASAVVNSVVDGEVSSVSLSQEEGLVYVYDTQGSVRTIEVALT